MPNESLRANALTMSIAKSDRVVGQALPDDLAHLPDLYAMPVIGDCLAPEIPDGALVVVDKTAPYKVGDLVIVFRRGASLGDQPRAMVKRLLMAPPPWVKAFPFRDHPQSDVHALMMLEQINPRGHFTVRCADVLAIHRCFGVAPDGATLLNVEVPGDKRSVSPRAADSKAGVRQ